MSGEFLVTIGNSAQITEGLSGTSLKGRREPRLAMVGRSNVGKSTLINALLGTRLAQTSAEPGKTRLLHFYVWLEARKIIADLPGYGYAKASKEDRDRWAEFVQVYLRRDEALERALVLLDARHGPTEIDGEAIRFLATGGVPMTMVFTKSDSLKTQASRASRKKEAGEALRGLGLDPAEAFWVSAKARDQGLYQLSKFLGGKGR